VKYLLDKFVAGFPAYLEKDVENVLNIIKSKETDHNCCSISENCFADISLDGEKLQIPYRFYHKELIEDFAKEFTETEQIILHCIYSRSCNGFTRQKHIESIFSFSEIPKWTLPYIIKLCDEYVMEIIKIINNNISKISTNQIAEFVNENKNFIVLGYARMVSYLDCYYKGLKLKKYVGYKFYRNVLGYNKTFYIPNESRIHGETLLNNLF